MTWQYISGEIQTAEPEFTPKHCRFEMWTKQPEVLLRIFQPGGATDLLIEESYVRGRTCSQTTYEEDGPSRRLDTHIVQPARYYERVLNEFLIPDEVLATFTSLGISPRKLGFDYQTQVEGEDWLVTIDYETGFIARLETSGGLVTTINYQVGELVEQPPAPTEESSDPPVTEIYDYDLPTILTEMGLAIPPKVAGLVFKSATRYVNLDLSELIYAAADGRPWLRIDPARPGIHRAIRSVLKQSYAKLETYSSLLRRRTKRCYERWSWRSAPAPPSRLTRHSEQRGRS
jgi:hypothetical protein